MHTDEAEKTLALVDTLDEHIRRVVTDFINTKDTVREQAAEISNLKDELGVTRQRLETALQRVIDLEKTHERGD